MLVKNLKAYLANVGLTIKQFAKLVDCNVAYMSRIAHEKELPSRRLAKDIYFATNGVISLPSRKDQKQQEEAKQNDSNPT